MSRKGIQIALLVFIMAINGLILTLVEVKDISGNKSLQFRSVDEKHIKPASEIEIPASYYQELELNKTFIYNVTYWEPGAIISYWGYDWLQGNQGDMNASTGGQIHVNFTGFYSKNPSDDNVFSDPVPYINMTIFQNKDNLLIFNNTYANVSNSEAGYVLALCYNTFRAGFLIPVNNYDLIIAQAFAQDTDNFLACEVNINEYLYLIKIEFLQSNKNQNISLIYDKETGILVWAKVETIWNSADFIIELLGYEMKFQEFNNEYSQEMNFRAPYIYNITKFDNYFTWVDLDFVPPKGDVFANPGGQVIVNFTGFYTKHQNDTSSFSDPIPYIDISFYENRSNSLFWNSTYYNVSCAEAAINLAIGYNNFNPGFLIPIDFTNRLKQLAYNQSQDGWWKASIIVEEFDFLIKFVFKQSNKYQNTTIIYDKNTGLLVFAKVENFFGPDLEFNLTGYIFNFSKSKIYDESDREQWNNVIAYVGTIKNRETILIGVYDVSPLYPFIKISIEIDNPYWQLSIILINDNGYIIYPIENGNNGNTVEWAVYIATETNYVRIYMSADITPQTSGNSESSGVNYYINAASSTNYKNYSAYPEDEEDDDSKPKKAISSTPILLLIFVLTSTTLILTLRLKKNTKKN